MESNDIPFTHDCGQLFSSADDLATHASYLGEQETGTDTRLTIYSCHHCGSTFSFPIRKTR